VLGATCPDATCRHSEAINSIAFSVDGTRVVTTSNDTTVRVWDAASGQPVGSVLKHANQLRDAIFWGATRVVSASADRTAHVWNLTTGREEAAFFGHAGIVNSVALSADQRWLVTASDDSSARVWDVASRETVAILAGHVDTLASAWFSTERQPRIVTAGADGSARVYACEVCADLPVLRALAATRVTRALTPDERRRFLRADASAAP
jgi:WD40 repeat protein